MLDHNPSQPPSISKSGFLAATWTLVAVSFGFLLFRVYVRLRVFRRLSIDDPLVIASWLMTVANAAIWQANIEALYLVVGVTSGQVVELPSDFLAKFFAYSHAQFASYMLYYLSLYTTKVSFLLFFHKLGNRARRQRIIWWSALLFVVASYAVSFSVVDFRCLVGPKATALGKVGHMRNPRVTKLTDAAECASPHAAHYEGISLRSAAALDIVTDFAIILVSTNVLWKLQIDIWKKLALAGICSVTAVVICVAITRVVVSTSTPHLDIIKVIFWGNLELSIAIIVACLASFRTLYTVRSDRRKDTPIKGIQWAKRRVRHQGSYGIPLKDGHGNDVHVTASEHSRESQNRRLSTSTEAYMIPPNTVHVRQDFSVVPDMPRT